MLGCTTCGGDCWASAGAPDLQRAERAHLRRDGGQRRLDRLQHGLLAA